MVETGKGLDPVEWAAWRGAVEARMQHYETMAAEVRSDVREIKEVSTINRTLLTRLVANGNGGNGKHVAKAKEEEAGTTITFKWVVEKVVLPLLLAVNAVLLGALISHLTQGG